MNLSSAAILLIVSLLVGITASASSAKESPGRHVSSREKANREKTNREETSRDETIGVETMGAESSRNDLDYTPEPWPDAPDIAASLRRLAIGTAIVLGLCVGTLWVGKRWLRGTPARATSGSALRLIETISLGNRCAVHLIQTGDHQVLVGVDGSGFKSMVPLPPSFERAIADARSPDFETVEDFEGSASGISAGQLQT